MRTPRFTTALTAGMILASMAANTYGFEYSRFPVTFDPPKPQAFQPFTVSFRAFALADRPIAIQVDGNAIIVDYAGQSTRFATSPPPEVNVQTRIEGLAPGDYVVKVFQNFSSDSRGQHRLDNAEKEPDWPLTVSDTPPALPVHAFYNAENRHYFITASDIERNGIFDGKAGSNWIVLNEDFQVWPAEGPAPEATQAVCRFYSEIANSHFYAVEGAECEHLKREGSGWAYEGIAFRTLTATAGSCPAGTDPIWRLYNNRAAANDSNHRFTSSTTDYRSMIAAGWIGEGAVFCSPR